MRKIKKIVLVNILIPIFKVLAGFWLERKYLQGRYFDHSLEGWVWVWKSFWFQCIMGVNRHVPWPCSPAIAVDDPRGVIFHSDDIQNFNHFGCYFSNVGGGKIEIGRGTLIAPNVGIITTNHDVQRPKLHQKPLDVCLGKECWLGMGCVILPGVHLGDHTIVGAGSVVTRSFPEGWCVIAGNPAKLLKKLDKPENGGAG